MKDSNLNEVHNDNANETLAELTKTELETK